MLENVFTDLPKQKKTWKMSCIVITDEYVWSSMAKNRKVNDVEVIQTDREEEGFLNIQEEEAHQDKVDESEQSK